MQALNALRHFLKGVSMDSAFRSWMPAAKWLSFLNRRFGPTARSSGFETLPAVKVDTTFASIGRSPAIRPTGDTGTATGMETSGIATRTAAEIAEDGGATSKAFDLAPMKR